MLIRLDEWGGGMGPGFFFFLVILLCFFLFAGRGDGLLLEMRE